jgi:predicted DNA-binding transcriptional regulator AlpA
MNTILIPTESDFRKWIKEAIQECLQEGLATSTLSRPDSEPNEPLLTRKEIAGIFGISLVTLHDWINRGLPCIKQGGRVYFLRSEVMDYVKQKRPKWVSQL